MNVRPRTIAALVLALTWLTGTGAATTFAPCETDEARTVCYWDAGTRGNGEGRSFLSTGTDVIYLP